MFNRAFIVGALGADPESRKTSNDKDVCNIRVATNEGYGDKQQTEWHRVTLWGKSAEIAQKYLQKGSVVIIMGQIKTRSWEDNAGVKKFSTELHVGGFGTEIKIVSGGKKGGDESNQEIAPPGEDLEPIPDL